MHILLVEAEEVHIELVRRALECQTGQVHLTIAQTLREAHRHLAEAVPDLAIVDLYLPDGEGKELLPADKQALLFPIIMLIKPGDERKAVEAIKAGALDYIVKGETPLANLPGIIDKTLQEWSHTLEQRQAEIDYHKIQRIESVGRLAAGIAHDFNNLLTVINGFADLLQAGLASDDPHQESVDKILRAGQRAAELVKQLLAFSRKQMIIPQKWNLNQSVAEMESFLRRIIGEAIELETYLTPDLWLVEIDPAQLQQVILNLALNARDAVSNGGRLTIETTNIILDQPEAARYRQIQPGRYVLLTISDNGQGMSAEIKEHIFEPFFTTKEVGKGTGLGLSVVYGIIKQSGGDIWVDSTEGSGTTFKIYLPVVADSPLLPIQTPPKAAVLPIVKTVLLVEDEVGARSLTRRVLQEQGYQVLAAKNGQEALQVAAQQTEAVHLLLTDLMMPGMNGKVLAEQLKQRWPSLKILFISGYADHSVKQAGMLEPYGAFLQKPFSPDTLVQKVRAVLDQ